MDIGFRVEIYLEKKQGSKVHAINEFRDKTNTLSVRECCFRDGTNPAVQGLGRKNVGVQRTGSYRTGA